MTLTPDELKEYLRYEPESGRLFWLPRPGESRGDKMFNARTANTPALTVRHGEGYLWGQIAGRRYLAHRVVWALVHGSWPEQIDHINGDRADNRIANLREVSSAENARNRRLSDRNTTGVPGVQWDARRSRWRVRIGRKAELGSFDRFEDAVAAREAAQLARGYHANHGRI